jgi:ElaB/YqjD/DUF883 family membrane-anchored ribosome-binding protein
MDANELLALKRPLTAAEIAIVEDELLKLAQELQKEVDRITADLGDEHNDEAERLKAAAAQTLKNIEEAIAVPMVPVAPGDAREA